MEMVGTSRRGVVSARLGRELGASLTMAQCGYHGESFSNTALQLCKSQQQSELCELLARRGVRNTPTHSLVMDDLIPTSIRRLVESGRLGPY